MDMDAVVGASPPDHDPGEGSSGTTQPPLSCTQHHHHPHPCDGNACQTASLELLHETRQLQATQQKILALLERAIVPKIEVTSEDVRQMLIPWRERRKITEMVAIEKEFLDSIWPTEQNVHTGFDAIKSRLFYNLKWRQLKPSNVYYSLGTEGFEPSLSLSENWESELQLRFGNMWPDRTWPLPLGPEANDMRCFYHLGRDETSEFPIIKELAQMDSVDEINRSNVVGIIGEICCHRMHDGPAILIFRQIALAACLFRSAEHDGVLFGVDIHRRMFGEAHLMPWGKVSYPIPFCRHKPRYEWVVPDLDTPRPLYLDHSIRSFESRDVFFYGPRPAGIRASRQSALLRRPDDGQTLELTEKRFSLQLRISTTTGSHGSYSIISFMDLREMWKPRFQENNRGHDPRWKRFGLHVPPPCFTGLAVFQFQLCSIIVAWQKDWKEILDSVEEMVSLQIEDIADAKYRRSLMYDTLDLERSDFYFGILQILRIFWESINETTTHLEELARIANVSEEGMIEWVDFVDEDNASYRAAVEETLRFNWAKVLTLQRNAADLFLARISAKTEDIKSLRDGLFNAQSVREAIKGTQINQYLLVFTIVTIIYLPPTFVATFYGMHLFDADDSTENQRRFFIVFGAVSGLTYLLALVGLSGINRSEKLKEVASKLKEFWHNKLAAEPTAQTNSAAAGDATGSETRPSWFRRTMHLRRRRRDEEKGKQPAT
ncbi:hypothetical protein B0H63DRAFT_476879 [Podospora didyma]|uniref:Uncharacterized protein n=1 Tax=Podospora didyma TaxID=330526 RepID=A0AAE0NI75_9PEZI|nr:hypothetical protein B0H63DRAFT_476879 [Podospora didyma]